MQKCRFIAFEVGQGISKRFVKNVCEVIKDRNLNVKFWTLPQLPSDAPSFLKDNLIDFDFSANNGGWQWAASTGCDAQPYFRVFNPTLQSEKFDPEGKFIKKSQYYYRRRL